MAQPAGPMTERDLAAIINRLIDDSVEYEGDLRQNRKKALDYYEGHPTLGGDAPFEEDHSSVVSRDLSDTHGWIMPSFLRVFLSSDRVVIYQPRREGSEHDAQLATDYINYTFLTECNGYAVLHAALWNALLFGNGVIKHWWDSTPEYRVETFTGKPEIEYLQKTGNLDAESGEKVLEHTAYDDPNYDALAYGGGMDGPLAGAGGEAAAVGRPEGRAGQEETGGYDAFAPQSATGRHNLGVAGHDTERPELGDGGGLAFLGLGIPQLHDFKIKRCVSKGRLCLAAIPSEEFRLDPNATILDEKQVRFAAHVCSRMRSDLLRDGYPADIVNDLPATSSNTRDTPERHARERSSDPDRAPDKATELIDVWECYIQVDFNGDGEAEWRRVVTAAGVGNEHAILANEEWGDDLPFTDLVPDPMPHRWRGGSLFEEVADIQRIKTVLWRGINDNLYWHNNPMLEAVENSVSVQSMDALAAPRFGEVIWTRQIGSVQPMPIPFVADKLLAGIEFADRVKEFRTGVSAATMALDPEALVNQTATAVNAQQTASYSKVETYARNIAEYGGLKRLFGCIYRLIRKNQEEGRKIRLKEQWVDMNPSNWDDEMDVVVNVGLGSGSRDRDLAMLQGIAAKYELISGGLGPVAAAKLGVGPDKYFNTLRKMVEASGLKSPEQYFPEITKQQVDQIIAEMAQQAHDPKAAEIQARVELLQAQAQAAKVHAQVAVIQAQAEADKPQRDMQQSMFEMERIKAQIENLRASAMANMTNAGAIQSDAELNKWLAQLEALDHAVSWHHEQQKINHSRTQMMARVQTPGVRE